MNTKTLIIGGIIIALAYSLRPNQREKNISIISKNPLGFLSTSKLYLLKNLTDEELIKMAQISKKYETNLAVSSEETIYYTSLINKYNLQ